RRVLCRGARCPRLGRPRRARTTTRLGRVRRRRETPQQPCCHHLVLQLCPEGRMHSVAIRLKIRAGPIGPSPQWYHYTKLAFEHVPESRMRITEHQARLLALCRIKGISWYLLAREAQRPDGIDRLWHGETIEQSAEAANATSLIRANHAHLNDHL